MLYYGSRGCIRDTFSLISILPWCRSVGRGGHEVRFSFADVDAQKMGPRRGSGRATHLGTARFQAHLRRRDVDNPSERGMCEVDVQTSKAAH